MRAGPRPQGGAEAPREVLSVAPECGGVSGFMGASLSSWADGGNCPREEMSGRLAPGLTAP